MHKPKKPETITGSKCQRNCLNYRAEESRSVHEVNDCNKEITRQTQLAAPVTKCLFYSTILLLNLSKNSLEYAPWPHYLSWGDLIMIHSDYSYMRRDLSRYSQELNQNGPQL